jgi:hypothetical protein
MAVLLSMRRCGACPCIIRNRETGPLTLSVLRHRKDDLSLFMLSPHRNSSHLKTKLSSEERQAHENQYFEGDDRNGGGNVHGSLRRQR